MVTVRLPCSRRPASSVCIYRIIVRCNHDGLCHTHMPRLIPIVRTHLINATSICSTPSTPCPSKVDILASSDAPSAKCRLAPHPLSLLFFFFPVSPSVRPLITALDLASASASSSSSSSLASASASVFGSRPFRAKLRFRFRF